LAAKLSEMIEKFRCCNLKIWAKFNIERPLTSMASKTALPNILKIASIAAFFPRINMTYILLGGLQS
jgi:hypothetical protein